MRPYHRFVEYEDLTRDHDLRLQTYYWRRCYVHIECPCAGSPRDHRAKVPRSHHARCGRPDLLAHAPKHEGIWKCRFLPIDMVELAAYDYEKMRQAMAPLHTELLLRCPSTDLSTL
jgi:hypothetical protein